MSYDDELMEIGDIGEKEFYKWATEKYGFDKVKYVGHENGKVDFFLNGTKVEIKTDTYINETGNMVFEFCRLYLDPIKLMTGWGIASDSTLLFIYAIKTREFIPIRFDVFREITNKYIRENPKPNINVTPSDDNKIRWDKNHIKITFGLLIPKTYWENNIEEMP